MTPIFEVGELVVAINKTNIRKWRVVEIEMDSRGEWRYLCRAAADTKKQFGFDAIKEDFKESELDKS